MTTWRKSTYSHNNGCFEIADTGETVAVRNSNHPDRGTLTLDRAGMAAWITACAEGEFDDLPL